MSKIVKEIIPYIIIIIVVVLIRTFLFTPVVVVGDSMVPTLENKQILLLDKISYRFKEIKRFDIVVIDTGKSEIIKRIIGLPGETVEYKDNLLYINGEVIESIYNFDTQDFTMESITESKVIPEDKYLVLGDNRLVSSDSRIIGLIDKKDILGKTSFSIWPIKKIK